MVTKSLLFCLRYDPLIFFWRQNHVTFIFVKMMSHHLLVQMAYCMGHNKIFVPFKLTTGTIYHDQISSLALYHKKKERKLNNQPMNKRQIIIISSCQGKDYLIRYARDHAKLKPKTLYKISWFSTLELFLIEINF